MIKVGTDPFLECSSKGDTRFSAFYAKVKWGGQYRSIEDIYQGSKVFEGGITNLPWRQAKGLVAINMDECAILYSKLWDQYFEENPELLDVIKEYNGFSDIFGQKGRQCQAIEIYRIRNKETAMKKKEYKVIVAGSRGFKNKKLLFEKLDYYLGPKLEGNEYEVIIVSGTAKGADTLGEEYAARCNLRCIRMPADWNKYGKSAGYIRNEEMAKIADACIVFWDGVSPGTKHMIELALKYKLAVRIVKYHNGPIQYEIKELK